MKIWIQAFFLVLLLLTVQSRHFELTNGFDDFVQQTNYLKVASETNQVPEVLVDYATGQNSKFLEKVSKELPESSGTLMASLKGLVSKGIEFSRSKLTLRLGVTFWESVIIGLPSAYSLYNLYQMSQSMTILSSKHGEVENQMNELQALFDRIMKRAQEIDMARMNGVASEEQFQNGLEDLKRIVKEIEEHGERVKKTLREIQDLCTATFDSLWGDATYAYWALGAGTLTSVVTFGVGPILLVPAALAAWTYYSYYTGEAEVKRVQQNAIDMEKNVAYILNTVRQLLIDMERSSIMTKGSYIDRFSANAVVPFSIITILVLFFRAYDAQSARNKSYYLPLFLLSLFACTLITVVMISVVATVMSVDSRRAKMFEEKVEKHKVIVSEQLDSLCHASKMGFFTFCIRQSKAAMYEMMGYTAHGLMSMKTDSNGYLIHDENCKKLMTSEVPDDRIKQASEIYATLVTGALGAFVDLVADSFIKLAQSLVKVVQVAWEDSSPGVKICSLVGLFLWSPAFRGMVYTAFSFIGGFTTSIGTKQF